MNKLKPLLVTTAHRGVFFGYGIQSDAPTITLERAKMCVYWPADLHGVLGLASEGPNTSCKIGPEVSRITLRDVTAVIELHHAVLAGLAHVIGEHGRAVRARSCLGELSAQPMAVEYIVPEDQCDAIVADKAPP